MSKYIGEYKYGLKDGIGIYKWPDNTMYNGEWKKNNIEGYGIYNFKDGRIFYGEWKNNQMNGYGECVFIDNKKFCGFYKKDKKNGFGIFYLPKNKFFIGFWKEGKQNGVGKFIKDDIIKYGIWKDGKREKWFNDENEFIDNFENNDKKLINGYKIKLLQLFIERMKIFLKKNILQQFYKTLKEYIRIKEKNILNDKKNKLKEKEIDNNNTNICFTIYNFHEKSKIKDFMCIDE